MKKIAQYAIAALIVGAALLFVYEHSAQRLGSTIASAVPQVATTSQMVVGPSNANTIFPRAANCTGRAITTAGQPVMLSFSSNLTPSATAGHFQATSTTVFYNNGDYGCGAVTAYGLVGSTTITVTGWAQ